MGKRCEGRVDRRIGGRPAPHREMFDYTTPLQLTTPLHLPGHLDASAQWREPLRFSAARLLLQLQGLIVHDFLRPYQATV
jgi:hypothetical protein